MTASVQVVFCMDTEGPCADPNNSELLGAWEQVERAMDKLFTPKFRYKYLDSQGGHLKIGWFFLTWTGFKTNPRQRAFGYHQVRDRYLSRWGEQLHTYRDEQCWHYHHPPTSGVGNEWGLDWKVCREYDQIISRQILERDWFPVCYRAGGTIMDNISSRWVDSWFPFDYSNRAPLTLPGLVDWSIGMRDWSVYHPDPENFCQSGTGRRRMARCLDLVTRVYALDEGEIRSAFERAKAGKPAIIAVFDHDYRDIADRINDFRARVHTVAQQYPHIPWQYLSPVEAIQDYLGVLSPPRLELEVSYNRGQVRLWSSEPLFQSIPWLAVKTQDGTVKHLESGIERIDATHWRWIPPGDLDWVEAAFAGSTDLGEAAIAKILPTGESPNGFLERPMQGHPQHPRSIWEHSKLFPELCIKRASGQAPEMDSLQQTIELLKPHLKRNMTVLDVGCGAGHGWHSFKPLGVEYYGIDPYHRGVEIGQQYLAEAGLPEHHLRVLPLEDLPPEECYDAVVCLNTLYYFPMYHQPLEIMARAARRWLVIRSSFGEETEIRYLPDVLLEPGFQTMHAYFNIFGRSQVQSFLEKEGFRVTWIGDRRQTEKFAGQPEIVGGIELPYQFLFAERIRSSPNETVLLGDKFSKVAFNGSQ